MLLASYAAAVAASPLRYGFVSADVLRVRSGPGTENKQIGSVNNGDRVDILGEARDSQQAVWYRIQFGSGEGYVHGDFIANIHTVETNDGTFESYLTAQGFPESYKNGLRVLHSLYPSWKFTAVDTGLDWSAAVDAESKLNVSLVSSGSPSSWKSTIDGAYNWSSGTWIGLDSSSWVQASREIVAYYMDPRNFLSADTVFQFLYHGFDSSVPEDTYKDGLRTMLLGSFMYRSTSNETVYYANGEAVNYIDLLYRAGRDYGVSPYVLGAIIRLEQGYNGISSSISGNNATFPGYYNYFNIGAYATAKYDAPTQGLLFASASGASYGRPWNTREKAILGGAQFFSENYTNCGQNTQYFKRFNVKPIYGSPYTHQYMTNIQGAYSEGKTLAGAYSDAMRAKELTFYIPIYRNMPESTQQPSGDGSPNNKLASLSVAGQALTPGFSRDVNAYDLVVENEISHITVSAAAIDGAARVAINGQSVASGGSAGVGLQEGSNAVTVRVTAQNGAVRDYVLNVVRRSDPSGISISSGSYTLSANGTISGLPLSSHAGAVLSGVQCTGGAVPHIKSSSGAEKSDADAVATGDLLEIRRADGSVHRSYTVVIYGDVNGDSEIDIVDYLKVRNVIIQTGSLSEAYYTAGDVNRDGVIDIVDFLKIRNHIIGTGSIEQ